MVILDCIHKNFEKIEKEYKDKKILLYGAGVFFEELYKEIDFSKLNIIAIADKKFQNNTKDKFYNFSCYSPNEIPSLDFDILLTTVINPDVLRTFLKDITKNKNIIIKDIVPKSYKWIKYVKDNYNINLTCPDEAYQIIPEIFYHKTYELKNYIDLKEHIVIDMGMNRGYASLYFAHNNLCKKVYGFEPCKKTYNTALEQFNLNPDLKEKIIPHNFGISNEDKEAEIFNYVDYDFLSTTNETFRIKRPELYKSEVIKEKIILKNSKDIVENIFRENNTNYDYILKIDIEGSEYEVLPQLQKSGLLSKFKIIIGEFHKIYTPQKARNLYEYMLLSGQRPIYISERPGTIVFLFAIPD
ncbi:MAG: FkbM family methyltransferase [Candidatus Gastranaerophilales bacterium]|nr:FkbM family methyltransferase [Candidatus Gastranaerophilales bacterium]